MNFSTILTLLSGSSERNKDLAGTWRLRDNLFGQFPPEQGSLWRFRSPRNSHEEDPAVRNALVTSVFQSGQFWTITIVSKEGVRTGDFMNSGEWTNMFEPVALPEAT